MARKQYRLGEFVFAVDTENELIMPADFSPFEDENGTPDLVLTGADPMGKKPIIPWLLEDLDLRSALLSAASVVLHSSYIVHNGKAVLFTAPSGTGKSTQAALWEKLRGATVVNGDRALIQKTADGFTANGIFYSGSSGICRNITAPLGAIVVLGRGNAEIRRLGGLETVKAVLPQCGYDTEKTQDIENVTQLLSELSAQVPVYFLAATMDERSVVAVERAEKG
ncbi:MAG: hypothetical protein MJ132_01745 [Clostridia bacterium]|nr:hypothetical protein [Clostridia bacterium]